MICSQCGHLNDDSMKFCTNCGALLQAQADTAPQKPAEETAVPAAEPVPAVEPVAPAAPQAPDYEAPQPTYQQPVYQQPQYAQPQYQQQYQQYQYPQYQQPMYQQPMYPSQPIDDDLPGKGLGITSMIFGILSLVFIFFSWVPPIMVIDFVFCLVGLILGIVGKSKASRANKSNGRAVAGIVCSAIALGIFVIAIFLVVGFFGSVRF